MTNNFKQTDIGLIPDDWDVNKLSNLLLETNTRNPSKAHPQKMIKYIDVTSVSNELFNISGYQYIKGVDAPGRARKVIYTNDVIFATIRPTLKRIAKVTPNINNEYCSTAFCVIRTDDKLLHYSFIYYYFLTDIFINEVAKHQYGASYPAVRDDDVKNIKIPLPSLSEQKKIAHILSKIQQAIETQEQIIKTTQELKKALMQKLFTEGLNGEPQKQTEIGLIPESWEVVTASSFFDKVTDGTHDSPKKLQQGYPLVTSKCLKNGIVILDVVDYFISEEDYNEVNRRSKVDINDILFSMIGTIGEVARISEKPSYAVKNVGLFKTDSEIKSEFAFYWFQTEASKNYIHNNSSGSTQKYIPLVKLRAYPIAKPQGKELKKIVAILKSSSIKVELNKSKLETLKELFQISLNKLMTGQIRVKDIEFKIEEVKVN